MPQPRISHKRQLVQLFLIAAVLLLPFVTLSDNPFLRMDITRMTLFLAGIPLRIDQFYLVLLLILTFVSFFLLMTAILGRVWCGWLCPQTVLNDLAELLYMRFKAKVSPSVARLIEHLTALMVAMLIAFNLFCWFMPPSEVASRLLRFTDHQPMFMAFLFLTLFGYLNLMLVKRRFCRSYCPYGRFQAALMDAGTLNLLFLEETQESCLRCNACLRSCPMDIDIRSGFQIECISCGRCIDACRDVMEKRPDGAGLIDYRFGVLKGSRFRIGIRTCVLLCVTLLLAIGLVWGIMGRSDSAFALQRIATAEVHRLPDGSVAQPWRAIIGNRSEFSRRYSIRVADESSGGITLLGPVHNIAVEANQHREITFMIHINQNYRQYEKLQLQLLSGDTLITSATITP